MCKRTTKLDRADVLKEILNLRADIKKYSGMTDEQLLEAYHERFPYTKQLPVPTRTQMIESLLVSMTCFVTYALGLE